MTRTRLFHSTAPEAADDPTMTALEKLPQRAAGDAFREALTAVGARRNLPAPFKHLNTLKIHEQRAALWRTYERLVPIEEAKRLGQYFTPVDVCKAVLSALSNPKRILDPTMGHGVFLRESHAQFPDAQLVGVELDTRLSGVPELVLPAKTKIHYTDFFEWLADSGRNDFDAIVGNPPYVSYQALSEVRPRTGANYRSFIIRSLRRSAQKRQAPPSFERMLNAVSGYSDLSTYVLAGAWLALSDEGTIAFVMSNHWLEREYGRPLIEFLEQTGSLRVIAADPERTWFSNAQVPTSIVVYDKGRSRRGPVPVLWPARDQLTQLCLRRVVAGINDNNGFSNLQEDTKSANGYTLAKAGWQARQGLRTGCNGFFYVQATSKTRVAGRLNKGESPREFSAPTHLLRPAIVRLGQNAPLALSAEDADCRLLDLNGACTKADAERVSKWVKLWPHLRALKTLPEEVSEFVSVAEQTTYHEGKRDIRIPELSAVKTNVSIPRHGRPPAEVRFWYHVPLHPRHFGALIVPRVSYGLLRTYSVDQRQPVITDANFITLLPEGNGLAASDLWLAMNSNVFREAADRVGTVLGGGALKLETTQLRSMPVPTLRLGIAQRTKARLARLLGQPGVSDFELADIGREIDETVLNAPGAEARRTRVLKAVSARRRKPNVPRNGPASTANVAG